MSAVEASSARREEGAAVSSVVEQRLPLDKVRALQWTLYRCAKQEPERRFHALYGHVHRMDVLWRAWAGVCANRGAPGVDGVTVDAVADSGVEVFLRDLSERLRTHTYRPSVLRRVQIPKPGRPGEFRPLSIPTVADRVVMTAAKLVLEPVFEAGFTGASYGFRPKRSAIDACEAVRCAVIPAGCFVPASTEWSGPSPVGRGDPDPLGLVGDTPVIGSMQGLLHLGASTCYRLW